MKKVIVSLCILLMPCISNGMIASKKKFFEACEKGDETTVRTTLENLKEGAKQGYLNCTDSIGQMPLHIAAGYYHPSIIKLLCEHKADPNKLDHYKCSPLESLGALRKEKEGEEEYDPSEGAQILIDYNADVNYIDDNDCSILAGAVQCDGINMVKTLLNAKADPNLGSEKTLPLYIVATEEDCSKDMVKALLDAGAQVNETIVKKTKNPEIKELLKQAYNKQKEKK